MTEKEWESLCDGCGRCCLLKLEDEEGGEIYYSRIACEHLDIGACRCTVYDERCTRNTACIRITLDRPEVMAWLPASCAYRRLHEGRGLADWHPLVAGTPDQVVEAGVSITSWAVTPEGLTEADLEYHIIDFGHGDDEVYLMDPDHMEDPEDGEDGAE